MPVITLETVVHATIEEVFDLARNIDLHMDGTKGTNEVAIAGTTSGLITLNEAVTWRATHFGVRQTLTSVIASMEIPTMFEDRMVAGVFKKLEHIHSFEPCEEGTLMRDTFVYEAPFGVLGRLAESMFLTDYLRRFIMAKNQHLKSVAESDRKNKYLPSH